MKDRLKIYDILREFHKKKLHPIMDKKLTAWDMNALEALDSVFYLAESVFVGEEKK